MKTDSYAVFRKTLAQDSLFEDGKEDVWRVGCSPFVLSRDQAKFLQDLGQHLLNFYIALNRLYLDSVKGVQPVWVHEYLDLGKPPELLEFARMNRFKNHVPGVIRPDLILTQTGLVLTELDSVPGGMGLTGSLSHMYADQGQSIWPSTDGLTTQFSLMLKERVKDQPLSVAIVVSDEADDYRAEMRWLARHLANDGWDAYCVHPRDIRFTEDGLRVHQEGPHYPISLLYRFYELFDLKNIPKNELIQYSAKKGRIAVTPPYKPWLEEKLALALIHHPLLDVFWEKALSAETMTCLRATIPPTWILDPRPLPPSAIIPGIQHRNHAVSNWDWLGETTQKERQYVLKVSGFSEMAWGSRGVSIGHDLSQEAWGTTLSQALDAFYCTPSILQTFHKGQVVTVEYYEYPTGAVAHLEGRVRLSPYYFVVNGQAELGGVLATICPKDKKVIHGMRDAVMSPCTVH